MTLVATGMWLVMLRRGGLLLHLIPRIPLNICCMSTLPTFLFGEGFVVRFLMWTASLVCFRMQVPALSMMVK